MAINQIPTGILPEEIVEALPEAGEENKVYRRLVEDEALREMQITDDFIWYDNEWHEFSFDARIFGAYFERFQKSVIDTIADLTARIEALESGKETLLFSQDEYYLTYEEMLDYPASLTLKEGDLIKIVMKGAEELEVTDGFKGDYINTLPLVKQDGGHLMAEFPVSKTLVQVSSLDNTLWFNPYDGDGYFVQEFRIYKVEV